MRKEVPMFITILSGLAVVFAQYAFMGHQIGMMGYMNKWFNVSKAIAIGVGVISLTRLHANKIRRRRETWPQSIALLVAMYGYILVTVAQTVEGPIGSWVYEAAIVPMGSTMYGMIAFWITSAAYRAFRIRSWQATVLLIFGAFVMLGKTPLGPVISELWGDGTEWLMNSVVTGVFRGIKLGAYLGAFSTALRTFRVGEGPPAGPLSNRTPKDLLDRGGGVMKDMWERLLDLDRRIIWALMFVIVGGVLLNPIGLPIKVTETTRDTYNYVDQNLNEGDVVWVMPNYSAGAVGELNPELRAFLHHSFSKGLVVVMSSHRAIGPQIGQEVAEPIAKEYGYEYGKDWINLGMNPGGSAYVVSLTKNVNEATAGTDHFGDSLQRYPIMDKIPALDGDHADFILEISTNACEFALNYASSPTGVPMACGTMQMGVPREMPFYESGQYVGLFAGLKGAAEYEALIGKPGPALAGMDVTSMAAVYVTLLLIIGNLAYVITVNRGE